MLTSRINNKATIPVANLKSPALDAKPSDLPLLEKVFQPREILNLPRELPIMAIVFLANNIPIFASILPWILREIILFFNDMERCAENCHVIHQIP